MTQFHLAQMNIAKAIAPLEDPIMAGFMSQLDYINALADRADGFVWRLQSESGNATDIPAFEDPAIVVNMSVWESMDALHRYTYQSDHIEVLKDRRKWFHKHEGYFSVLWWVPAGHLPSVEEGKQKLETLIEKGPSSEAFTFAKPFPKPSSAEKPKPLKDCSGF